MKQNFFVDIAETFKTYVYEHNRVITPASATLTVYNPGGSTKLIDAQAMTVNGDGLLSYDLTASDNDIANENYKAVVTYVYNSETFYITLFYDVVHSKLFTVITDDDIVAELPQLKDAGWKVHGTAESGTTTTIVDTNLLHYADDYFTGGLAYSADKDETREITNFDKSTGTITTVAFGSAIATDKYILTRAYTQEIQRAFEKIEEHLVDSGKRANLILDPYDLRGVHICYAVAEVCKGLIQTSDEGIWAYFFEKYESRGYSKFKSLNLKYDESDDGYITGSEESKRLGTIKASRS